MHQDENAFADLAALTQLYLLQNHSLEERLVVNQATYEWFLAYAKKNQWPPARKREASPDPVSESPASLSQTQKEHATIPAPPPAAPRPEDTVALHPPSSPPPVDQFSDFRRIFSEKFPSQQVLESPPSEGKVEVGILSAQPSQQERLFLNHLATAITVCYCPASVISKDKASLPCELRLVIGSESSIDDRIAGKNIPFVRMLHPSQYLKNPLLKAELWKAIDQHLSRDG